MAKPANFPSRINERRRSALARIDAQLHAGVPVEIAARLTREADTLALRIQPDAQARAIRTKKTKALGWSAARAAYRSGRLGA